MGISGLYKKPSPGLKTGSYQITRLDMKYKNIKQVKLDLGEAQSSPIHFYPWTPTSKQKYSLAVSYHSMSFFYFTTHECSILFLTKLDFSLIAMLSFFQQK